MNHIGILSPDGTFTECVCYGHLDKASEIAKKLDSKYADKTDIECEEYLQKSGYIILRARDVYGLIGYLDDNNNVIHLSREQRKWLEEHYDNFPRDKQQSIDELIDRSWNDYSW